MSADIPLICDAPLRNHYVLKLEERITLEQAERLQMVWRHFIERGETQPSLLILDRGATLEAIGPQFIGWPDAEHCAA